MKERAFTVLELLIVIAIIGSLMIFIVITTQELRAKARDAKRLREADAIFKGLALYYASNNQYPEEDESWICIEETIGEAGGFAEKMEPYFSATPQDPLYPQEKGGGKIYAYQYKTINGGQDYKVHMELEMGESLYHEIYSEDGAAIRGYAGDWCSSGVEWGGYCWYEGELGQNCVQVCAPHGGNVGTCQERDTSNCDLCKLFRPEGTCHVCSDSKSPHYRDMDGWCHYRHLGISGSCTNAHGLIRRFCACNE